jgi:hypothetical protein
METAKGELVPGGLAMVIRARNVPQNLGKTVTLSKFINKGDLVLGGIADSDIWVFSGDDVGYKKGGAIILGKIGVARPGSLMPINPEADPLEQEHEQCQTA